MHIYYAYFNPRFREEATLHLRSVSRYRSYFNPRFREEATPPRGFAPSMGYISIHASVRKRLSSGIPSARRILFQSTLP